MIIRNGSMHLICINGFKQKEAMFIRTSNNELIKASNCIWDEDPSSYIKPYITVQWGSGRYFGPVGEYLKNLGN